MKIVSAGCVKNNEGQCNIFWLDVRDNRALMVMAVASAKEQNLLDQNEKWYQGNWSKGLVSENSHTKLIWDIEFNLRKTTTSRRTRFDAWTEANESHQDMRYGMLAREQFSKEETGKENQLQATSICDKREKTWIKSYSCVASDMCICWMY